MKTKSLIVVLALLSGTNSFAGEVSISESESLSYDLPKDFRFELSRDPDDGYRPALKFSHFGQGGFKDFGFKVYLFKPGKIEIDKMSSDKKKEEFLSVDCKSFEERSLEGKTKINKFVGKSEVFYCSFTDAEMAKVKDPLPGQFRNVTIALVFNGDFEFLARAYSNSIQGEQFKAFLDCMATLKVVPK